MRKVRRDEILDHVTFTERREEVRRTCQAAKDARRIHVGEPLTFLFENADTMRWQIQEMMRVERIVRENDVQHEIDTYNELLGDTGELACTLLVEIEDPKERDAKLARWLDLPDRVYVKLADGTRVRPRVDDRQRTRGRLSTVQYLKFPTAGSVPVAVGCDHPEAQAETALSAVQIAALRADLAT